ncbi:MAG: 16S rRNA (guanine(527)-N(7))-methyltransferase RsmG [Deltaproteobacteria bacterium]|nr:16S rRNA (guanine(527)-N(7))-methyltransferase RsmG [Deltaproteobacteria bacterium]
MTSSRYDFKPFYEYLQILLQWNSKINLTSLNDPRIILEELFVDSLFLVDQIKMAGSLDIKILDIGSGAGLPGIPLKIALPAIQLTLVESIKKKSDFIKAVARKLSMDNLEVLNLRLHKDSEIGRYDIVVSRGTMSLSDLVRLSLNFVVKPGTIITMKGEEPSSEISELQKITKNNLIVKKIPYSLPMSGKKRTLIVVSHI